MIWPIAFGYGWNYEELLNVAKKRFPQLRQKYPLNDENTLAKHCNTSLKGYLLPESDRKHGPWPASVRKLKALYEKALTDFALKIKK